MGRALRRERALGFRVLMAHPAHMALLGLIWLGACSGEATWPAPPSSPEAPPTPAERQALEALEALRVAPRDEERIIWYGRRLAYLGEYEAAVEVYTRGLELHPSSPKLLRHRGHRYITLRRFGDAQLDFARAVELIDGRPDEVEPDGQPNERGIPTSTLHTNVWYHHGLALYCQGEFARALECYERCLLAAKNPDMESAARYWLFLTASRLGDTATAQRALDGVQADWDIIENHAYFQLLELYRGDVDEREVRGDHGEASDATEVSDLTLLYGLARWEIDSGREAEGHAALTRLAQLGSPAFACIAAEADVGRLETTREN